MNNTCIKTIDIKGLWKLYDFHWELSPQVNILAGGNGSGKSTILRCLTDMFRDGKLSSVRAALIDKITITFSDGTQVDSDHQFDPTPYKTESISTFDMSMKHGQIAHKYKNGDAYSELDWELHLLHTEYLNYQLEVSKEIIAALSSGNTDEIKNIVNHKNKFFDIIDTLFAPTGKRIDRENNALKFILPDGKVISPERLSSGEKQMLIILTTALIKNRQPGIIIMDEPEISLHFDWQRRMLEDILGINANIQLIVATHSPAVVMGGWVDCVSEVSDLMVNTKQQEN